ncbi:glycosyl hydrolase family 95 catalytic domain-containing protein [Paenibacillus sp. CN-4]|uniref:glycosyl hydrolase family 95 catalytic domain-containing protein n=1 Tax=Paenibacillus nanchangensis TaxID=3348343 RepID=UPI00397C8470
MADPRMRQDRVEQKADHAADQAPTTGIPHMEQDGRNVLQMRYPASWRGGLWREALPAGNGRIGASVYGGVKDETILLQHGGLWHWGQRDPLPDVSGTLAETRRIMDEGNYREASRHLADTLRESGYASKLASRFPLAALTVTMPAASPFTEYRRELDMETGVVTVRWREGKVRYARRLFVSRADDCIVYQIEGGCMENSCIEDSAALLSDGTQTAAVSGASNIPRGEVALTFPPGDRVREDEAFKRLEASIIVRRFGEDTLCYAGTSGDGEPYGAVLRIVRGAGGKASGRGVDRGRQGGGMDLAGGAGERVQPPVEAETAACLTFAGPVRVLIKLFTGGDPEKQWARLRQELSELSGIGWEELLVRHTALHRPLFQSADLELGGEGFSGSGGDGDEASTGSGNGFGLPGSRCISATGAPSRSFKSSAVRSQSNSAEASSSGRSNEELLIEAYEGTAPPELVRKMWAYGRYLFISGTSEEGLPFGLYGLWGGDYRLMWGHHMANENIQMMYWHAAVGGLSSLVPGLFRHYEALMDDFRDNARKLYGCRGIFIPAATTPGIGLPTQIVPVILNWTGAAGWLAAHYYEHYRFTGDERFLRERALPFMVETLRFYEDFLVQDEQGQFRIYPSVSPENTPLNFMPEDGRPMAHPMPTAINATMDIAILKELLRHTIEAARLTGLHSGDIEKWQGLLHGLPEYELNEAGAVREWQHPAFEDRQDHRHLSHLYPVFPGREITQESDPELFRGFEQAVKQRRLGAQTGWSLAHMASVYARLGDGGSAQDSLSALARSCLLPNFFTLHNDWRGMGICMDVPSAPVQLDANMGWVNAVQEMLLSVSSGRIKLLPALPPGWQAGSFTRWRVPGGKLSLSWRAQDGELHAVLTAERRIDAVIQWPEWANCRVRIGPGGRWNDAAGGSQLVFRLEAGQRMEIEPWVER